MTHITPNLTRVFGLRPGVAIDERLARMLLNPKSVITVRYVKSRGVGAAYVGGLYLESVEAYWDARKWLLDVAERVPELPHLKTWAERL